MTTSLTDMLELPNFAKHITISRIQFESRDEILLVASWKEIMTSYPLLQNTLRTLLPTVYKIEVMATSLTEMLELPNFGNKLPHHHIYKITWVT